MRAKIFTLNILSSIKSNEKCFQYSYLVSENVINREIFFWYILKQKLIF